MAVNKPLLFDFYRPIKKGSSNEGPFFRNLFFRTIGKAVKIS